MKKRKVGITSKCKNLLYLNGKSEDKHPKNKNYHKIRDHCRYTGEYRDAAHSKYNLNYSLTKEIKQKLKRKQKFFTMDLTIIIILS